MVATFQPSASVESSTPAAASGVRWPGLATATNAKEERRPVGSTGKAWGAPGKAKKGPSGASANMPSGPAVTGQIQQLKEMGFSEKQCRQALKECIWDVNKALDLLFTRGVMAADEVDGDGDSPDSCSANGSSSKGIMDEVESPKVRQADGVASSGNGEQSTTASTASSPRSAACLDKSSTNSTGASAPVSPSPFSPLSVSEGPESATACCSSSISPAVIVEDAEEEDKTETAVVESEAQSESPAIVETETVEATDSKESEVEAAAPEKQLTRVIKSWDMDSSGGQLCVKEGDFVLVWQSSQTEHGWIYTEDHCDSERSGWLPCCALEEPSSHQRWMKCTQTTEASQEGALSLQEGAIYKVDIDTRTKEGWIYAEASDESQQAGWVPVFSLEGAADLQD